MSHSQQAVEAYPEENAANYVDGRFDPRAAEARRAQHLKQFELQAKLKADARTIAQRHRPQPKK
jgi:hypothetical protein